MDIENMRPATKEEKDAIEKYIASISVDTGFNIWDLQEQVKVYDAYRNKGYSEGYKKGVEEALNRIATLGIRTPICDKDLIWLETELEKLIQ